MPRTIWIKAGIPDQQYYTGTKLLSKNGIPMELVRTGRTNEFNERLYKLHYPEVGVKGSSNPDEYWMPACTPDHTFTIEELNKIGARLDRGES